MSVRDAARTAAALVEAIGPLLPRDVPAEPSGREQKGRTGSAESD